MGIPGDPCWQWLSFIMNIQSSQVAPRWITAQQFDATGFEHQPEQQPPKQPKDPGRWGRRTEETWQKLQGRKKYRQKTGFQKKRIPLEPQKLAANNTQREIQQPHQK